VFLAKKQEELVMSTIQFTIHNGFKSSFLNLVNQSKNHSWPKKMPYTTWQKLLRSLLWFIGKSNSFFYPCRSKRRKKLSRRYRRFLKAKIKQKNEIVQKQTETIIEQLETIKSVNNENNEDIKLELITMLKQFWKRKHMPELIGETIPDRRNQDFITYSKQSIMMSVLSIFLFRMGSGNKFDVKSHDEDEKYSKENIAKFIDAPEDCVPVIKTIEKFLRNLEEKSVNDLMIAFFKDLQKSKFFQQHPQLMPGNFFLLAADCVHTHTYDHLHHVDMKGENDCDCCLKRIYNKGTDKEKIRWMHNVLVYSFVFMGGLKIPIYRYPIHAKQVIDLESAFEEIHKQECEIVALKATLPIIRQAFPKMKIVLLLDGLYANRPVMRLAEENRYGYIIVRKEECLPSLAKECDEHAKQSNHKKNCTKRSQTVHKGWAIEQKYEWFNSRYLGDNLSTHVLRFSEIRTKEGEEERIYTCEWLFSWRLSANNCESAAFLARARWEIEDLFNSLKCRGYNLRHDYSRNPRSCFNWQGLALLAFGIFELFRCSEAVKKKGDWPQVTLAEKLLAQLLQRPTDEILSEQCLSKKIQFRYCFVIARIVLKEILPEEGKKALKTG
jgi:hypothetical protein